MPNCAQNEKKGNFDSTGALTLNHSVVHAGSETPLPSIPAQPRQVFFFFFLRSFSLFPFSALSEPVTDRNRLCYSRSKRGREFPVGVMVIAVGELGGRRCFSRDPAIHVRRKLCMYLHGQISATVYNC